jgi:hypothetical protein
MRCVRCRTRCDPRPARSSNRRARSCAGRTSRRIVFIACWSRTCARKRIRRPSSKRGACFRATSPRP